MRYAYTVFDLDVEAVPLREQAEAWAERTFVELGIHPVSRTHASYGGFEGDIAYTILWALSESHAVIHAAPEDRWVEVVFALCKPFDRDALGKRVIDFFRPRDIRVVEFEGVSPRCVKKPSI